MLFINYVDVSFLIKQSLHDFNQDLRIHDWLNSLILTVSLVLYSFQYFIWFQVSWDSI